MQRNFIASSHLGTKEDNAKDVVEEKLVQQHVKY
jgi:hypothetical protein